MKNIQIYLLAAVVALLMMVASAFLLTAADAEIRQASGYVTLIDLRRYRHLVHRQGNADRGKA